eukprot:scaffold2836_cov99-Cylindrotheca_fusiformis.AAC.13
MAEYFMPTDRRGNAGLHPTKHVWTSLAEFHLFSYFHRGDDTRYFLKSRSKDISLQDPPMEEM